MPRGWQARGVAGAGRGDDMRESTDTRPADRTVSARGDLVVDTHRRALARVMAVDRDWYALRPPNGGLEWTAVAASVRPATAREELAEKMRARGLLPASDTGAPR